MKKQTTNNTGNNPTTLNKSKVSQFFSKIWAWIKENKTALIMFLILLFFQQLSWSGNMILGKDGVSLELPIDSKIPIISEFVYIYYLAFPLVIFAFFWICRKDKVHGWNLWLTSIVTFVISGIIYLCFQTQMTKPDFTPVTLSDKLLIMTWNACKPINCFPSQHCVMAILLFIAYYNQRKTTKTWFRVFNYICGILIVMATVFLKQHYIVDMFGSLAIVLPAYIIIKTWNFGEHMENKMAEWAEKKAIKQAITNKTKTFASEILEEEKNQTLITEDMEEKTNNTTQETNESPKKIDKTSQENEHTLTTDELKNITSQDDNTSNIA